MSNSVARHRTHSSKTLNADRDRSHARSSRELALDPLMAAFDCFSLTLKVHSKKSTNARAWAVAARAGRTTRRSSAARLYSNRTARTVPDRGSGMIIRSDAKVDR